MSEKYNLSTGSLPVVVDINTVIAEKSLKCISQLEPIASLLWTDRSKKHKFERRDVVLGSVLVS